MIIIFILNGLIMCIATYYLLNFYIIFAKKMNISSIPNERSSHTLILPRGAGIVFGIIFLLFTLPSMLYFNSELSLYSPLLFCGFTSIALGFFDDLYDMNSILKLFMQFIILSFMVYLSYPINFNNYYEIILYIFVVISFVWFVNSINFVDGIDGIISSLSLIISLSMVFIIFQNNNFLPLSNIIILFALNNLIFLFYNWSPAKVFMGDSGSLFIGTIFCFFIIYSVSMLNIDLILWIIMFSYILIDTSVTLIFRLFKHEPIFKAHKSHAYQNLAKFLNSHSKTTIYISLYHIFWLLPLMLLTFSFIEYKFIFFIISIVPTLLLVIIYGPMYKFFLKN